MNTSLTSVSYSPQEQAIATGSCVGKNNPLRTMPAFRKYSGAALKIWFPMSM